MDALSLSAAPISNPLQAQSKPQAQIVRAGNLIQLSAGYKDFLHSELSYTRRVVSGQNDVTYVPTTLYSATETGELIIPAGLTARVASRLRLAGVHVEFTDLRSKLLPDPMYENISLDLRVNQIDALTAMITCDGGIINAPTGAGKSTLMRAVCTIWPTVNIIICCPITDVLRASYLELLPILNPNELGMVGGGKNEQGRRVTLTTDKSLCKCDLDACRIFLFDEVHKAAAEQTAKAIGRIRNARMFGFSASAKGRSDNADLETEALFGPEICSISYQDVQAAGDVVPVDVWMIDCSDLPPYQSMSRMAVERNGVWKNHARNARIAQAVNKVLQEYGEETQVLISVKVVEHAVYLSQHLPSFEMVYATMAPDKKERWIKSGLLPTNYHGLSPDGRDKMRVAFRGCTLKRVIATSVWGTGVDFPHLNVLIRADAQSSSIAATQIPGRVTRPGTKDNVKQLGIVIDLDDSHHTGLGRKALERVSVYKKKGWNIKWITL